MRFPLLSYVAAVLLLAAVLGANLIPVVYPESLAVGVGPVPPWVSEPLWLLPVEKYGWPFECVTRYVYSKSRVDLIWTALAANIAIGLTIPIAGLFACEFVLRRYVPRRKVE